MILEYEVSAVSGRALKSCTRCRPSRALETAKPERLLVLSPKMLASPSTAALDVNYLLLLASLEPPMLAVLVLLVPRLLGCLLVPV